MTATLLVLCATSRADPVDHAITRLKLSSWQDVMAGAEAVQSLGAEAVKAAPHLVEHLASEHASIREACREALVAIGPGALPRMIAGMKRARDEVQRRELAKAFAEIGRGNGKLDRKLVRLLDDPDPVVRETLAPLFAGGDDGLILILMRSLGGRSADLRAGAAAALGAIGPAAAPRLEEALAEGKDDLRAAAVAALGHMGDRVPPESARKIPPLAKDGSADVRLAVAESLGRIGQQFDGAAHVLVALMPDPDARVRAAAVNSAVHLGPAAAGTLVGALGGASADGAGDALVRIGKRALDALDEGLASGDAAIRAGSVRTLGNFRSLVPVDKKRVRGMLADDDAGVRRAAAFAILRRGNPSEITLRDLEKAADDPDPSVRAAVLHALRHAPPKDGALAAVQKASKNDDPRVRVAAAAMLWQWNMDSDVVSIARNLLQKDDAALRDAAARALRPMGRAAEPAIPDLVALSETYASLPLVDALGAIAAAHGNGVRGRRERFEDAPLETRKSIDGALAWLGRFQDRAGRGVNKSDGRWHPTEFPAHDRASTGAGQPLYSAGVTGLAVSAFLAAGRVDAPEVNEGLGYLIKAQNWWGVYGETKTQHFQLANAYALIAMCEAWILTGDPRYRRSARRGVDACLACRNPGLAWRYEPRGGENDTNVTVATLHALALAERGGLDVDPAAFAGGGRWLIRMTSGAIGYNVPGGSSARPAGLQDHFPPDQTGSMSAAGLWGFTLVGRHGVEPPDLDGALDLCRELPPLWQGGRLDMYYWYYGTLAFHARCGRDWNKWYGALSKALVANQRRGASAFDGSWDPTGPWGADGGRVYSTALRALALATPIRLSDDFAEAEPHGAYADAAAALRRIAKSGDGAAGERAALRLRRAGAK